MIWAFVLLTVLTVVAFSLSALCLFLRVRKRKQGASCGDGEAKQRSFSNNWQMRFAFTGLVAGVVATVVLPVFVVGWTVISPTQQELTLAKSTLAEKETELLRTRRQASDAEESLAASRRQHAIDLKTATQEITALHKKQLASLQKEHAKTVATSQASIMNLQEQLVLAKKEADSLREGNQELRTKWKYAEFRYQANQRAEGEIKGAIKDMDNKSGRLTVATAGEMEEQVIVSDITKVTAEDGKTALNRSELKKGVAAAVLFRRVAQTIRLTRPSGPPDESSGNSKFNIVYSPTPELVVEKMLELAKVTKKDVVFDLGCGDGRIVVTAAKKYGAKGVGVDINPARIKDAMITIKKLGVAPEQVELREGDALKVKDLERATVVTLYMNAEFMRKLEVQMSRLKPGSRIVAHDIAFPNQKADQIVKVRGPDRDHMLFLWTVKERDNDKK